MTHPKAENASDGMFPMDVRRWKNGDITFRIEYIGLTIRQDPNARFADQVVNALGLKRGEVVHIESAKDTAGKKIAAQLLETVQVVNDHYNQEGKRTRVRRSKPKPLLKCAYCPFHAEVPEIYNHVRLHASPKWNVLPSEERHYSVNTQSHVVRLSHEELLETTQ